MTTSSAIRPLWLLGGALCWVVATARAGDDVALIERLKGLQVSDLIEVEVSLDAALDIFDALPQRRSVKVASGAEQPALRAPAVTSVITAEEIEAMGARDLDEVLESVPGLHVNRNFLSYSPQFTLRGVPSDFQVLMMQNGVPTDTLYTGGRNYIWGGMPVTHIERIEIIRGPGSAIYGADAFAGVINIVTKTREDIDGTEVGTRLGEDATRDYWINHGARIGGLDVVALVEYQRTDGLDATIPADAQSAMDATLGGFGIPPASNAPGALNLQKEGLDARLDLNGGPWRLRLGYQGRRDIGLGFTVYQTLDPGATQEDDRFMADLTYHQPLFNDHWDLTAQLSLLDMSTRSDGDQHVLAPATLLPVDCRDPAAGLDPRCQGLPAECATPGAAYLPQCQVANYYPDGVIFNGTIAERQLRGEVSAFYFGLPGHTLRLGGGYYFGDLYKIEHFVNTDPVTQQPLPPGAPLLDISDTPYSFLPEESRTNWHLFVQDTWALARDWELTTGLRFDDYSDFGGTLNPRLALVWQANPEWSAKALYGRAFRAPSFIELYTRNNVSTRGSPDLEAETIDTAELALDYAPGDRLHLTMNLYHYDWRNVIAFLPDASGTLVAQNGGQRTGRGLELEARWKVSPQVSLVGNYSLQDVVEEDGAWVGRVPRHMAYLRADWLVRPNWYLDLQTNWVGSRAREAGDPREPLEGYTTVDLNLRYKDIRRGGWNVAVGVRNLFDEAVYQPSFGPAPDSFGQPPIPGDLPERGRYWFTEVRYQF
jgi:outer membrane receptor protein involved in Fe transport